MSGDWRAALLANSAFARINHIHKTWGFFKEYLIIKDFLTVSLHYKIKHLAHFASSCEIFEQYDFETV